MDQEDLKLTPMEGDGSENNDIELETNTQSYTPEPPPEKPPVEKPVAPAGPAHVLPAKRYKLKAFLMSIDFLAIVVYIYYLFIKDFIKDDEFSFTSNKMCL